MSHSLEQPNASDARQGDTPIESSKFKEPLATAEHSGKGGSVGRVIHGVLAWTPSVLVVATLSSLAWYGHHHDWKLPKFAALATASTSDVATWCETHGVPEDICIVCRDSLIENAAKLTFCNQHGVHGCVLCNPSLAETKKLAEPTPADLQRAERALALKARPENLSISSFPGTRIQFASIEAMNKAGVDVELVERQQIVESISASAEILYDATKTAQVSPQSDGTIRSVSVQLGDWVKRGQVLALIDSSEVGRLKTVLSAAMADERLRQATVDRLRPLAGSSVAEQRFQESENDLQQATAAIDRAVSALGNLGIRVDVLRLRGLDSTTSQSYLQQLGLMDRRDNSLPDSSYNGNLIAMVAPLEGQIVSRLATVGAVVDRGTELFQMVDTRVVWLDLRVAAEDASLVELGQSVVFMPDGHGGQRTVAQRQDVQRRGLVSWISTDVDAQTRTVRVRAELDNRDQSLRNESFGHGQIVLRDEPDAIVVPESAVQWDGHGHAVFVRDSRFFEEGRPKFFVARSVRPGVRQNGFVEIIAGVLPGEVVASDGSDVLRAQLLRSNLGAGCTCGK